MHFKTLDFLWLYSSCLTHSFYTQITFTAHTHTHTHTHTLTYSVKDLCVCRVRRVHYRVELINSTLTLISSVDHVMKSSPVYYMCPMRLTIPDCGANEPRVFHPRDLLLQMSSEHFMGAEKLDLHLNQRVRKRVKPESKQVAACSDLCFG